MTGKMPQSHSYPPPWVSNIAQKQAQEFAQRQAQAQANACRAAFGGQLPSDLYNAYKAPQRRTNKIGIPLIPLEQNPYVSKV